MNQEIEIIREFILPEDEKLRVERFEIALSIVENLKEIKFQLKKKLIEDIEICLIKKFEKGWSVIDEGLKDGKKYGALKIYKKSWEFNGKPIASYSIESERNRIFEIHLGIIKSKENQEYRNEEKLFNEAKKVLKNGKKSPWWVCHEYTDGVYRGMWDKEFFMELITNARREKVINYFVNTLIKLKEATETLLDEEASSLSRD